MNYIFHGERLVKGLREKNVFIREIQPHVSLQFFFLTALSYISTTRSSKIPVSEQN